MGRFAGERYLFLRPAGTSGEILLDFVEYETVWLLHCTPNLTKCLYQVPLKVRDLKYFFAAASKLITFVDKCCLLLVLH